MRHNSFKQIIRVCVCVCVCVGVCVLFSSQSSCQHQTIRALTPCRPRWSPAYESMGTVRGEKKTWQLLHKNMVQLPPTHTHTQEHVHVHARLRGSPPHGPSSEACQTLTPLIICPDTEVWAGVITSEPWLFTQRSGPDRAWIILPGFLQVRDGGKARTASFLDDTIFLEMFLEMKKSWQIYPGEAVSDASVCCPDGPAAWPFFILYAALRRTWLDF